MRQQSYTSHIPGPEESLALPPGDSTNYYVFNSPQSPANRLMPGFLPGPLLLSYTRVFKSFYQHTAAVISVLPPGAAPSLRSLSQGGGGPGERRQCSSLCWKNSILPSLQALQLFCLTHFALLLVALPFILPRQLCPHEQQITEEFCQSLALSAWRKQDTGSLCLCCSSSILQSSPVCSDAKARIYIDLF